jgi:alpha-beta hydrolase superfamily lysophospholipase
VLVIGNSADNACTPSHTARLFDAVGHADKMRIDIAGATHYYAGQPEQSALAARHCAEWFEQRGWQ